ncbi:PREDICTED: myeloid cell surface antigen CD33-like isoform X1 [Poecilia mexicana]|uniref:myeloid cell surface antigen CD33-like isoform X1 n=2 Tax=Poecilia mexicana TaxID=48701 RepID=UPI00072D9E1D|nr:PREDICTED: myeloid cell surface antigen CD33-like isoform X1 [Poecilia mexicana]
MAAQSENMLTVSMLLSVFFLPGVLTGNCYKPPTLFITAPEKIEALTGSCLQIPCSFNTKHKRFDSSRTVYGVWMKKSLKFSLNQNVVIFNSSKSVNTYPLKMIGNLGEKNCTTLFPYLNTSYTDKYFFRVENGPFRATACAKPLQITVEDSPWSPSINVPSDLKEHQSVTVTCSAFTPCPHSPPELTWNLQQDSVGKTEKNTDGTFTTKIQENITLSDTHDGYNITCSARYPVIGGSKTAGTEMTLSVSYAPRNTSASISPSGLVSAGSWVELSCSSRAKPPPRFTWFRISKHGDINVSVGPVYGFNFTKRGEYYCAATNDLGNQTSSVIHLGYKGLSSGYIIWMGILVGGTLIICLGALFRFIKSKRPAPQQTHLEELSTSAYSTASQPGMEFDVHMSASKSKERLQDGNMNFTQSGPEVSTFSVQDSGRPETVCGQVKVLADSPEDLCDDDDEIAIL